MPLAHDNSPNIDQTLYARLQSRPEGLTRTEAERRLAEVGPNSLPPPPRTSPFVRFLAQFHSAIIYFLLAAAAGAAILGHMLDASVILVVVLVNAIVGFIQEGRAEESLGTIRNLIAPRAVVRRNGERQTIDVADLVPGDIVLIEAGDRVPADLALLRTRNLTIDEAVLTGESVAAEKNTEPTAPDAPLGDRTNMAFSGTLVSTGQGTGIVTTTGSATEIGRISQMLSDVEELSTPLLRQINRFTRNFTIVVLTTAALLFAFAVLVRGFTVVDALVAVVALSVGVMPEGLPAVITITLAIGVQRMAARKAVIRKLPAVETLGATSVICTDKTGTLTRNEMTVHRIILPAHQLLVSGVGYAPDGTLTAEDDGDDAAAITAASDIIHCGLLCNDATLSHDDKGWKALGDPMEAALVALAMKAGYDPEQVRGEWQRVDEIPFDAAYRYMATLHRGPQGQHVIALKGAPEALLAMVPHEDRTKWDEAIARAAANGERVLGFAIRQLEQATERLTPADLEQDVKFLGIMGFIDPPREEARAAIAQCRAAGISVKMITGDHAATAVAIGRQLALADDPVAMTGAEIDSLSDAELADAVPRVSVFARTDPEHKLRIVRSLQARGAIVAMTGDGVNDAPALKQADVGTAMGQKGTSAAREAAQMVLLDDNFASIVAAVHEGRTVYDNIRKVISWTLPSNGGEALAVILAILFGFALPMTATQILWVNLILSATLGLVLAFEPSEPGVMARQPRKASGSLMSPFMLWRVVVVSLLMATVALAVFFDTLDRGHDIETARTMVVNTIIAIEIFYLFNVRYLHMHSLTWKGALGTPIVLGAIAVVLIGQLLFTYAPFMQNLFESRPLTIGQLLAITAIAIGTMLILEIEKYILRRLDIFQELRG